MKKLVKNILEMDEIVNLLFSVILEKYKFITFLCINGVLLYVCDVPLCCKNCFSVHARVRKGKQNEIVYLCLHILNENVPFMFLLDIRSEISD